jgi:hypothetical protein
MARGAITIFLTAEWTTLPEIMKVKIIEILKTANNAFKMLLVKDQ